MVMKADPRCGWPGRVNWPVHWRWNIAPDGEVDRERRSERSGLRIRHPVQGNSLVRAASVQIGCGLAAHFLDIGEIGLSRTYYDHKTQNLARK